MSRPDILALAPLGLLIGIVITIAWKGSLSRAGLWRITLAAGLYTALWWFSARPPQ